MVPRVHPESAGPVIRLVRFRQPPIRAALRANLGTRTSRPHWSGRRPLQWPAAQTADGTVRAPLPGWLDSSPGLLSAGVMFFRGNDSFTSPCSLRKCFTVAETAYEQGRHDDSTRSQLSEKSAFIYGQFSPCSPWFIFGSGLSGLRDLPFQAKNFLAAQVAGDDQRPIRGQPRPQGERNHFMKRLGQTHHPLQLLV